MQGSMWDSRIVLYCFDETRSAQDTIATLDTWVCWSLLEAQLGHYLDVDPWGKPYPPFRSGREGLIMGGYRAVLAMHKGDEKYLQKAYKTSRSAVSRHVCMVCKASSDDGPMIYTAHGPNAAHRSTLINTASFIEDVAGVHTWVKLPGWSPQILAHDWLHLVDLTLIPEASASALLELASEGAFGPGAMDERIRRAYRFLCRLAKQTESVFQQHVTALMLNIVEPITLMTPIFYHQSLSEVTVRNFGVCDSPQIKGLIWKVCGMFCAKFCSTPALFLGNKETSLPTWVKDISHLGAEAHERGSALKT